MCFDTQISIIARKMRVVVAFIYWMPQNSRNNSIGQCHLMLENNEKIILKNLYLLYLKI
jgi:hypothetical protein